MLLEETHKLLENEILQTPVLTLSDTPYILDVFN